MGGYLIEFKKNEMLLISWFCKSSNHLTWLKVNADDTKSPVPTELAYTISDTSYKEYDSALGDGPHYLGRRKLIVKQNKKKKKKKKKKKEEEQQQQQLEEDRGRNIIIFNNYNSNNDNNWW